MAERIVRSHRNIGPIQQTKNSPRNGNPSRDNRSAEMDDYHNFGGKSGKRTQLPLTVLKALASLINNAVGVTDSPKFLNAPDSAGKGGVGAGYTYLFQLAAHDLVDTQVSGVAAFGLHSTIRNLKRRPLALETIFGTGPIGCPFAYDTANPIGSPKPCPARLRNGYVKTEASGESWVPPAHDLPRISFDPSGVNRPDRPLETVLIADARNDDNLILGQLTGLFQRVYNFFVDQIASSQVTLQEEEMEELARSLLVRIYRRILRVDLLARIMHPETYQAYIGTEGGLTLDGAKASGTPSIEFALAAVRLGHGMVRNSYVLNNKSTAKLDVVLAISSRHAPSNLPLPSKYLVDWDMFFPPVFSDPPEGFNWAIRFGPHVSNGMKTASAASTPGPDGEEQIDGTVFRDLARENSWPLLSVDELLAAISPQASATKPLAAVAGPIAAPDTKAIVKAGLQALALKKSGPEDTALDGLIQEAALNPPLSLFLQFEAEQLGKGGATLGPLASVLVAEAMWPALMPEEWETKNTHLDKLETDILGFGPETMPQLLSALKRKACDIL